MKHNHLLLCSGVVAIAISLFSCRKHDFHDPGQQCKILQTSDRTFTYNTANNPVAFTYKEFPDWTGYPTFHFFYDAHSRLIAYGGANGHGIKYNSRGVAIIDTLIMNYAGQNEQFLEYLYYDAFGRISKVVSEFIHSGEEDLPLPHVVQTTYYNYDKRGNLILLDQSGTANIRYDNKTSIYRTNPIFMLIHRNYSVNNPEGETQYNAAGLPFTFYGSFLDGSASSIVYDCGRKNGK